MNLHTWIKKYIALGCLLLCLAVSGPAFAESQTASGVTAQVIIDRSRYYLTESTAVFWTDAELLVYLNNGVLDLVDMSKCLETTEKITLQTGTTQYSISTSYLSVEGAIYSGATSTYVASNFKGLKRVDIQTMGHSEDVGEPVQYYIWDDKFYIDPTPSSAVSGYTVMLYLIERPSGVTLTQAIPTPAAYDDALALFVASRALVKDRKFNDASNMYSLYQQVVKVHMDRLAISRGVTK